MFTQNMLNFITRGKYVPRNNNYRYADPNTYIYTRADGKTFNDYFEIGRIPIIEEPPIINYVEVNPITYSGTIPSMIFCFDASNEPAKIEDYRAIDPIENIRAISSTCGVVNNNKANYYFTFKNNNNTEITINSVEIFSSAEYNSDSLSNRPLFLLYREVFDAPLVVPAQGVFLYTMEITTGDTTETTTGDTNAWFWYKGI